MKKYRLRTGAIISGFIAFLAFLPQAVQETEGSGTVVMLVNVLTIFLYSFFCWSFNFYLIRADGFSALFQKQWVKLVLSFAFASVISYILFHVIRNYFGHETVFTFRKIHGRKRLIGIMMFRGSFVNAFLYFIGYMLYLSSQNQLAQLENERLKHENLEARLFVLRQQLSPHFLFNSLGILNTLTSDVSVHKYTLQLSNIYRYLLANHEGHLAVLQKEMEFINAYLYVVRERFEDALILNIKVAEEYLLKKLPPAALQLLIENAIKHNVVSADDPLHITISTEDNYIVVINTLNLKPNEAPGEGIGLHNIAERYRLLSGGEVIIEKTTTLFTVKLPLL